ncbi:MAG: hypothetical protein WC532_02790 [Candidatus Omnitrophota bacterium]
MMNIEQKISRYLYFMIGSLFSIICALMALHIFLPYTLFDLDQEGNIPTWFSSQLLFLVSIITGINYILNRKLIKKSERIFNKSWVWLLISGVFLFLSMDEVAYIHERLHDKLKLVFLNTKASHDLWMIVYIPFLLGGLFFLKDFLKYLYQLSRASFKFIFGASILWLSTFVLELVGQYYLKKGYPQIYQIEVIAEEGLEMLAALLFCVAFLLITKLMIIKLLGKISRNER